MKKKLWTMEGGELLYHGLHRSARRMNRADTLFDRAAAPYCVMLLCAAVDGAVFYSLFSTISYDRPLMLGVQIAGFLFGFDVVPIYIGIHLRRLRQGLSRDWFVLWLALAVCAVVCGMNASLRLAAMEQMASVPLHSSILGISAPVVQQDPSAEAMTVFGIGIPVVTSVGSFFISYLTYDPLRIRRLRLEAEIAEKRDEIRRFEAILSDYDAEENFARELVQEDEQRCEQMLRLHRAIVLSCCDYVRLRLKEQLGTPASSSVLSGEVCGRLMERLDRELESLEPAEESPEIRTWLPAARRMSL